MPEASNAKTDNNVSLHYQGYDTMEELINAAIKSPDNNVDTNLISDGYHTFAELYDHRITLYIIVAKEVHYRNPAPANTVVWKSKAHSDGSVWDGWFILGINMEAGKQITYHLPMDRWIDCAFARTVEKAPDWDGHDSAEVLRRLKLL